MPRAHNPPRRTRRPAASRAAGVTLASAAARAGAAGSVRLTVLGSGDAFGSGGRLPSAYLVEAPSATFLVDCGPSVLSALKRAGRAPGAVDFVLLSHLHGDHFAGVPFLFMEYCWESPRRRPLAIYGPADTAARVQQLFEALYERSARKPLPFALEYVSVADGAARTAGAVRIVPIAVPHAAELACYAYRIEVDGRSILYSGDTASLEPLVLYARSADLFLCECTRYATRVDIHVAYPDIAARARALGCRRLVLSHLGSEPLGRRAEITLECAEDGMTIEL